MYKKQIILFFGIVLAGAISMVFFSSKTPEEQYLKNISRLNFVPLSGIEKAIFRNAVMTMNPKTGQIPAYNVKDVVEHSRAKTNSNDRNFRWKQVDSDIAGRNRFVMIDPNDPKKLWVGSVSGGLWYNPDFRLNEKWVPVSDDWKSLSISTITYDPNNTNIYYVGTGESYTANFYRELSSSGVGIGMYKSTDAGQTWTLLPSTSGFLYINDIVVRQEEDISVIYVGVSSGKHIGKNFESSPSNGLFRSEDGGNTWTQVLPNITGSSTPYAVSDIELTSNGELYVGTMRNLDLKGGGIILNSTDGNSWSIIDMLESTMTNHNISSDNSDLIPGRVRLNSAGDMIIAIGMGGSSYRTERSPIGIRDSHTLLAYKKGNQDWEILTKLGYSLELPFPWFSAEFLINPFNNDQLIFGGLDVNVISSIQELANNPPLTLGTSLNSKTISDWRALRYYSNYLIPIIDPGGLVNIDSVKKRAVHADIHHLVPTNLPDELIIASDGGIHYTKNLTDAFRISTEDQPTSFPNFVSINKSLVTTQYYSLALHPEKGNMEVMGGTQDNSSFFSIDGSIPLSNTISFGDGAYCFYDRNNPEVRILSSQFNTWYIWVGERLYSPYNPSFSAGLFINPATYDDKSNLLYTNGSVAGQFEEAYSPSFKGFTDSLILFNLNKFLGEDDLGLDTISSIGLNTGTKFSFSVLKISPWNSGTNATIILGNQFGDVYKVEGLPHTPSSTKIDNGRLPTGYISSIDIGSHSDEILVTLSNYGINSVWYTSDGGSTWKNLERDLPDIPVRDGKFNPIDYDKVIIATELGIWGLESISDDSENWKNYNDGLPNVRVDMIQVRASDTTIAIATHGRGIFMGVFDQGKLNPFRPLDIKKNQTLSKQSIYPNPTRGPINFSHDVRHMSIYSMNGKHVRSEFLNDKFTDISDLSMGTYFIKVENPQGHIQSFKVLKR